MIICQLNINYGAILKLENYKKKNINVKYLTRLTSITENQETFKYANSPSAAIIFLISLIGRSPYSIPAVHLQKNCNAGISETNVILAELQTYIDEALLEHIIIASCHFIYILLAFNWNIGANGEILVCFELLKEFK